ncbi:hypothetical protein J0X14_12085 [Muricauda sp. CAU 1633]|uniref:hypothetical protein n=1 Tax=Allomuricauda sp. CAU 1633 TaxID=2816036 RepID=UPI001A8C9280|nr:hypothetical protein [Muricauda sp. CAU 1633]MBO0323038.1 hypothetical protein [Muricauda sp. CAU 1633]
MLITPKQLAEAIGINLPTLRKHIQRDKLRKSGKFIDTEFPLNNEYIITQTNGKGLDLNKVEKREIKQLKDVGNLSPAKSNKAIEVEPTKTKEYDSFELRKRKADAEKAERDNELKKIEIQKKMGKLMPVELMEKILVINVQSVFRSFEAEAENIASTYCEILGGDRSHLSEMTKRMREHLDASIKKTKKIAFREIKIAINDYAEVRSRGERK